MDDPMMRYERCPLCGAYVPDTEACMKLDRKSIKRLSENILEKCECGADVSVWSSTCSSLGEGYTVICSRCYPGCGPWAKTPNGARRLWNKQQKLGKGIVTLTPNP